MVEITHCVVCRKLETDKQGYNLKGAMISPIAAQIFPAVIPEMVVVLNFALTWEELGRQVPVTLDIVNGQDRSIFAVHTTDRAFYLHMARPSTQPTDRAYHSVVQMTIRNAVFMFEGMYWVQVSVDGQIGWRYRLMLAQYR